MENGISIERLKEKQRPITAMKSDKKGYTVGSNKIEICKLEKRSPDPFQQHPLACLQQRSTEASIKRLHSEIIGGRSQILHHQQALQNTLPAVATYEENLREEE